MTVFVPVGLAHTWTTMPSMSASLHNNAGHYVENTGDTNLVFLEMFKASEVLDFSLNRVPRSCAPTVLRCRCQLDW